MVLQQGEHDIAANNILFGFSRFLTLALPGEWRVTRSYLQPDVHANVRRGDRLWVEEGQTDQIVFHPLRGIGLDLTILVKRGKRAGPKTQGIEIHSRGSLMINGHEASYLLGEVGVGFLKRRRARTLSLSFFCEELGRTVMLSFTGKCQEADLLEILSTLALLKCH